MNDSAIYALVERQAHAWQQADLDAITADFALDGIFQSPGGRYIGPIAIRQAAEQFFQHAHQVQVQITRVFWDGTNGAVEWTWNETSRATGLTSTYEDAIIFTMQGAQISYWREYFDTAQPQIR
jgi:uncharacterized protein (TIGR02246 family)